MADVKSMHIGFPRTYIALSRGFSSSHKGIDMCWNNNYGGTNAPVFAPADGTVTAVVNNMGNTAGKDNSWGNLVKIGHGNNVYTLMAHLKKGSVCVQVGQAVKRGQQVALMNNSGNSYGNHVHYELYVGGSGTGYRVDPLKYCYAYPGDVVNSDTQREYGIMHYTPPAPIPIVGEPVERNQNVDQVFVDLAILRARETPTLLGKVLGYVKPGIYDVIAQTKIDGYDWYDTGQGFWCAQVENVHFYKATPIDLYDLTMFSMKEEEMKTMVAWAEAQGVKYEVTKLP